MGLCRDKSGERNGLDAGVDQRPVLRVRELFRDNNKYRGRTDQRAGGFEGVGAAACRTCDGKWNQRFGVRQQRTWFELHAGIQEFTERSGMDTDGSVGAWNRRHHPVASRRQRFPKLLLSGAVRLMWTERRHSAEDTGREEERKRTRWAEERKSSRHNSHQAGRCTGI